jgi:hypothetical protein
MATTEINHIFQFRNVKSDVDKTPQPSEKQQIISDLTHYQYLMRKGLVLNQSSESEADPVYNVRAITAYGNAALYAKRKGLDKNYEQTPATLAYELGIKTADILFGLDRPDIAAQLLIATAIISYRHDLGIDKALAAIVNIGEQRV